MASANEEPRPAEKGDDLKEQQIALVEAAQRRGQTILIIRSCGYQVQSSVIGTATGLVEALVVWARNDPGRTMVLRVAAEVVGNV